MTEREFASCMALLCGAVGREMSADQSRAWYAILEDLTLEQLKAGIVSTIRSYKFAGFPPVGAIREASGAKFGALESKDKATLAWCDARRAIHRVGSYESPNFADKIINATIRNLGGWVDFCGTPEEEMVWLEKRFVMTYNSLASCPLPDEQTTRLAGISERENGSAIPVQTAEVQCLTSGGSGVIRKLEEIEAPRKRLLAPAESLARRLSFDDREEVSQTTAVVVRDRDQQLAALDRLKASMR